MKTNLPNICVVTFPIYKSGITPLSNLISILLPLSHRLQLVTGNAGYTFFKKDDRIRTWGITHQEGSNAFSRVAKYVWTQLKYCPILLGMVQDVDFLVFFMGGQDLLIPMVISKLLRKNVVLMFEGSAVEIRKARKDFLFKPLSLLVKANCILSNTIIVYSERLVKEYGLQEYREKILVAPRHFLDFKGLTMRRGLSERANLVGFIGRLYEERGVLKFAEAIPKILKEREEVTFLIGGDGPLRNSIEKYRDENGLTDKVRVTGWISRETLSTYLNEIKLIVLPSSTEGLPNIMLEAMACGTPVLATPVGGVPDVIQDGRTGFLMKDNSPQCIAENVVRALDHPNLESVVKNAKALVEREFTYDKAEERYRKVIDQVLQK